MALRAVHIEVVSLLSTPYGDLFEGEVNPKRCVLTREATSYGAGKNFAMQSIAGTSLRFTTTFSGATLSGCLSHLLVLIMVECGSDVSAQCARS